MFHLWTLLSPLSGSVHDNISYFQSDTSFCLRLFNTGLRTASNGVLMYLYLQREGGRVLGSSLSYIDGEGGDGLAAVLHHGALAGSGVRAEGRRGGAERSEIKI